MTELVLCRRHILCVTDMPADTLYPSSSHQDGSTAYFPIVSADWDIVHNDVWCPNFDSVSQQITEPQIQPSTSEMYVWLTYIWAMQLIIKASIGIFGYFPLPLTSRKKKLVHPPRVVRIYLYPEGAAAHKRLSYRPHGRYGWEWRAYASSRSYGTNGGRNLVPGQSP